MLTVLFIGTCLFLPGIILAFTAKDKGRKLGLIMMAAGLFIYLVCFLFYPNNDRYRI